MASWKHAATAPPPPGELARQSLLLLSQDEEYRAPILMLIHAPAQARSYAFDPVSGTLLISAALFVLQTHIDIRRDNEGRWTFKFIKKPTKDSIITPLVTKLIALISGGPPTP